MRAFVWGIVAAILFLAITSCDSPSAPPKVASLSISPGSATVIVGSTQQFSATTRDANGALLSGRPISWSANSAATASVDANGLLTAIAPGTASVTAFSEGQSVTASVNVIPVPVASVTLAPNFATLVAGTTQQFAATVRDAAGITLTGRNVAWSSDAPAIATVDAAGLVTAIAPGTATVSAASEGRAGSATLTITSGSGGPTITGITPASLVPGTNVVISGVGFANSLNSNVVTIGGVTAPIVTVTATQLTVAVPCVESGNATVRVASNGIAGTPITRQVVGAQRTLPVGQALILSSAASSVCNELLTGATTTPARYLVAVFSASTSQNSQLDFELTGNTPPLGVTPPRIDAPRLVSSRDRAPTDAESMRDAAHFAFLERDRAQYEQLRARAARTPSPPSQSTTARMADLPALGDMRNVYYTFTGGCSDTTRVIRAKAIYIGTRSIIWEDSANTLQSSVDAPLTGYYRRLGQIFDTDQYESVRLNFGDPLLRDGATDNDGRVHMVFSQRLNGSGAAAYVTTCDQFPQTTSAGSNFGQYFYGSVPTNATPNINSTASPDGWFYFMGRTVVHEVKHIASISARVANNAQTFEQSWLEEGTARHAEELWVRESLHHVAWKANTGFGTAASDGVYCDFSPTDAICNGADTLRRPSYGMRRQFNEIREKLLEPWDWSPYGDASGQSSSTFYQTTWSLVRYTIDRYAKSDAEFFHTLINSNTNGTTNLAATAGVSLDQLIGGWGLALFADDYPGLSSPSADIQFATWNLRSIYAGLHALPAWSARWDKTFPIQPPQLAFGSFTSRVTGLRGGAHAFFEISGTPSGAQLIGLRSVSGGVVPSTLRIAITRLQ